MYSLIADICRRTEAGESIKKILYGKEKEKYSQDLPSIRALADTTLRNRITIDDVISHTQLSQEIVFNEVWIARVLVAELLFGKKSYHCTDKIGKKVYQYKEELKSLLSEIKMKDKAFVPRYCRINTFTCTKRDFHSEMSSLKYKLKETGGKSELTYEDFLKVVKKLKKDEYIQDYHLADLYIFHPKSNLTTTHLYQENKLILQDKASCLVAPLLAPTPGSIMLDMCAAPGFKTQHLSSVSGSSGLILAIDISKERYSILANTRINYDLSNVMTFNADSLHLPEMATKCIEYVLLDAPCSGSGVVQNYDYGTENRNNKDRLNSLHNLQTYMLRTVLSTYTSVRRIVYSTCSIFEEENEAVVEEVLDIAKENQFVLVNLKNHLQDFGAGLEKYKCGTSCIRLAPEQSCTNGFFIALFERSNPPNASPRTEFYKNLNDIIGGISCKRKRKADEAEIYPEGETKRKDNLEDKSNAKENDSNMDDRHKVKQMEKDGDLQGNLNEGMTEKSEKNEKKPESSSEDTESSSNDELKNTLSSPQTANQEKNYIRVVRSPLLKNPILAAKEEKSEDSEEEDSDEESEEDNLNNSQNNIKSKDDRKLSKSIENLAFETSSKGDHSLGEEDEMETEETGNSYINFHNSKDPYHFNINDKSKKNYNQHDEGYPPQKFHYSRPESYNRTYRRNDNRNNDFQRNSRNSFDQGSDGNWRGNKMRRNFRGRGNNKGRGKIWKPNRD